MAMLPLSLQALACGGNVEGSSTDPSTTHALSQSVETAAPRVMPVRLPGYARSMAKARGAGEADFELCSGGTYCATAETEFFGQFAPNATADSGAPSCTVTTNGACELITCTPSSVITDVSAGTLTLTGGTLGTVAVKTNAKDGYEYSYEASGALFAAGDKLTVAGSGTKKVAAFTAQTVVSPAAITLTAPTANAKGTFIIPTTADLTVTWTGGAKGDTVFVQGESETSTDLTYFTCGWKATAHTGSVPAAILAPMAGLPSAGFYSGVQSAVVDFSAGTYATELTASVFGGSPATFK
jgi:hypothetical protein